ncbi:MAG: heme-binding protein [Candidatus Acidiferrales bacterium]
MQTTACPKNSRAARPAIFLFALAALSSAAGLVSCAGTSSSSNSNSSSPPPAVAELSAAQVQSIAQAAAAAVNALYVIAITNREGDVLAVYQKSGFSPTSLGNFGQTVDTNELAVSLARTAAFFSNDQAPLSSRTVRFISGIHFPPGVTDTPNAALYGIENSNRGCTLSTNFNPGESIPPALSISGMQPSLGVATGKVDVYDSNPNAVNPGGVPIFENGVLLGGIGVAGASADVAEFAAYAAATSNGFGPTPAAPGVIFINGIALPFVSQTTLPSGMSAGTATGATYLVGPIASPNPAPEGYLVGPNPGPLGGLSSAQVNSIVMAAVATANQTRALIRLPIGVKAKMVISVADLDGTIIALYRMTDATVFSVDVAATKARNMAYFNSASRAATDLAGVPIGTAVTNRTIGFGAQPLYPPGIDGTAPGPFFTLYTNDVATPCTQGSQPANANQSGIVFFPGSEGIYINGVLVGGLGVSGDGVDQDDYVTHGGDTGFEPPTSIQADQIVLNGVRLPYLSFPRNPTD